MANIIEAEGNSIAANMISKAVKENGKAMIELRKIEAAIEISKNLQASQNVGFIPFSSNMLLNLNKWITNVN